MAEPPSMQLYAFWRSTATFRVRVALNLKGLAATEIQVDLEAGQQLEPEFLAINPQGAVPALVEPGQPPMMQSMAILEYLDERFPHPPLLPSDLHSRARVRSLAALMASDTHPLIVPRVRRYLFAAGLDAAAWRAWQAHWLTTGLQAMEARLAGEAATGTFCHGHTPGLADICLASVVAAARVFRIEVPGIPTVDRIVASCDELDAFAKADLARQVGAPK